MNIVLPRLRVHPADENKLSIAERLHNLSDIYSGRRAYTKAHSPRRHVAIGWRPDESYHYVGDNEWHKDA